MATLEDLLAGLGERTGLTGLEPDEEGLYTFVIGGTLPVFLRPAEQAVLLYAGIGSLPAVHPDTACRRLLEANHLWLQASGLSLGLLPGTSSVLLVARERLEALDPAGFFALFDRFVEAASAWRERLPELAGESQRDAGPSLTGEAPPGGDPEPSEDRAEPPGPGDFA